MRECYSAAQLENHRKQYLLNSAAGYHLSGYHPDHKINVLVVDGRQDWLGSNAHHSPSFHRYAGQRADGLLGYVHQPKPYWDHVQEPAQHKHYLSLEIRHWFVFSIT